MNIITYHIDTFTSRLFAGNPAAVCILEGELSDVMLQSIATENNLPVTAFLVRKGENFTIRWFTPEYELDLCGHGTLASSYVIFNKLELDWQEVTLHSPSEVLKVRRNGDFIMLDFAAKPIEPCSPLTLLNQGLGKIPKEIYQYKNERCVAVFESEEDVKQLKPEMGILKQLDYRGITVTAPGTTCDFVSRVFYPKKSMSEDAVTGASHCLLVPYWAKQFNKTHFQAQQLSPRGGELICELKGDRVIISGKAVLYMQGMIAI